MIRKWDAVCDVRRREVAAEVCDEVSVSFSLVLFVSSSPFHVCCAGEEERSERMRKRE